MTDALIPVLGGLLIAGLILTIREMKNPFEKLDDDSSLLKIVATVMIIGFVSLVLFLIFLAFTSGGSDLCGGGVTSYDC